MKESVSVTHVTVETTVDYTTVFNEILSLDVSSPDCNIVVCLASAIKNEAKLSFKQLQMTQELASGFCDIVENVLKQYRKELNSQNLLFPEYGVDSKPEDHEIEHLNLSAYDTLLEQIDPIASLADIDTFTEGKQEKQFVSGLRFYVIIVQSSGEEPIYFFRIYTPKKMMGRQLLFAVFDQGVYNRVEKPVLFFDEEIDCMSRKDIMFIFGEAKTNFQTMFRFYEEVRRPAQETLNFIQTHIPIQNFEEFALACNKDIRKLRRLTKIIAKPYMQNVTINDLKKVIEHSQLPIKIIEVDGREQLHYDPKNKWVILHLLNDDYLKSTMTNQNYEATGKREV